ncbi:putative carboxypeptidase [gamma proteobacterium HdN1]|nr:putative carboxypeptidase [gamma proteobacterium HdN1]
MLIEKRVPPMSYQRIEQHQRQLSRYHHLQAICGWDQSAMMPTGGNEARAEALASLDVLIHNRLTEPSVADWIATASDEPLTPEQRANLREFRRQWQNASLIPPELVEAHSLANSHCEHAWRSQRPANDWAGFAVNLSAVVANTREIAKIRADALGVSPYNALLALYEPGASTTQLDTLFADLRQWLPSLIQRVAERQSVAEQQKGSAILIPQGPFPIEQQKQLGLEVMQLLGFNFDRGRLDVSAHPFCGGVPSDVRITTRYDEQDFTRSLMGVIHETGHARYEQNLPYAWRDQAVFQGRSMGIHESQSLFFEMQLARHPAFLALLTPLLNTHFGAQPAFAAQNLQRLYTRVQPSLIRVDADEVTYPAHIILRYEIERALIEGDAEVEDIPALWDQKMQEWLGLSTQGDYTNGCMQDIHWPSGAFGYFPSYTLGAMYAAQFRFAIEAEYGDLGTLVERAQLPTVFSWLRKFIWQQGSLLETDELVKNATGSTLNARWFRQHLEQRYG